MQIAQSNPSLGFPLTERNSFPSCNTQVLDDLDPVALESIYCSGNIGDRKAKVAKAKIWRFVASRIVTLRLVLRPMNMIQLKKTKRVRQHRKCVLPECRKIRPMSICLRIAQIVNREWAGVHGEYRAHAHKVNIEVQGSSRISDA